MRSNDVFIPTTTEHGREPLSENIARYFVHVLAHHDRCPESSTAFTHPDTGHGIALARLHVLGDDALAFQQLTGVALVEIVMPEFAPPRAYVITRAY